MVWNVEIIEVGGKFIVRTVHDADIKDMEFESEGFARLYARGQRVHFSVLEEIALASQAEAHDATA